jgi:hypothetical protein
MAIVFGVVLPEKITIAACDTSHAQDMADQLQRAGYCVYHIVSSLPNIT